MKRWILVLAIVLALAAAGGGVFWWLRRGENGRTTYRTARVERGEIVQTVRATGIVQPIRTVEVGTQVNGPILKLYADYNDPVKAGDLVAQIDPRVYEARLAQDEASLTQALASVEQADARLAQADRELGRARELARRDMQSQAELDAAQAERDILAAQAKLSRAAVEQGQAALRLSRANLEYTRIRSPVDGVVIARNVSEGQTVVASMTAQVLFTVATDLRRIQVEASVPEADIGKVRAGQPVTFTVDAHDQTFHGTVAQVRMAATTVQNVVTYTVVIDAENPEGKLFPGMTATITCEIARRADALKVPNAALRFRPPAAADGATARSGEKTGTGRLAGGGASGGVSGGAARKPGSGDRSRQAVWIQKSSDAAPERVTVGLGITDGQFTELADAAGLAEGREVLVGLAETKAEAKTVNPFVPVFPGRNRPR